MRTDDLIVQTAKAWVNGGGDEAGIVLCAEKLALAVRYEVARLAEVERARVELNEQRQRWESDLHARARACWLSAG